MNHNIKFLIIFILCIIIYLVYYKINENFETTRQSPTTTQIPISTTTQIPIPTTTQIPIPTTTQNPKLTKTLTTQTLTYNYTGLETTWTPPFFITEATFTIVGGNGGDTLAGPAGASLGIGGLGASITITLNVSSDQTYNIYVGNNGYSNLDSYNGYTYIPYLNKRGLSSIPNPNPKNTNGNFIRSATIGNGGSVSSDVFGNYYSKQRYCGFSFGGSASALYLGTNPLIVAGGGGGGGAMGGDGENSSNVTILSNVDSSIITDGDIGNYDASGYYGGSGGGVPGGTSPPGILKLDRTPYKKGGTGTGDFTFYCGGRAGTSLVPNSSYIKNFSTRYGDVYNANIIAKLNEYVRKNLILDSKYNQQLYSEILNTLYNPIINNGEPYISITTVPYTFLLPNNPIDLFPNLINTNTNTNTNTTPTPTPTSPSNTYTNVVVYIPNITINTGDIIYLPVYLSYYDNKYDVSSISLNIIKTPNQFSNYNIITDKNFTASTYYSEGKYQINTMVLSNNIIPIPNNGPVLICYLKLTVADNIANKNLQTCNIFLYVFGVSNSHIIFKNLRNDITPASNKQLGSYHPNFCVSASCYRDVIDNHSYLINTFPPLCIPQTIIDAINTKQTFNIDNENIVNIINDPNILTIYVAPPITTQASTTTKAPTTTLPLSPNNKPNNTSNNTSNIPLQTITTQPLSTDINNYINPNIIPPQTITTQPPSININNYINHNIIPPQTITTQKSSININNYINPNKPLITKKPIPMITVPLQCYNYVNKNLCNNNNTCYFVNNQCYKFNSFASLLDIKSSDIKCNIHLSPHVNNVYVLSCVNTNKNLNKKKISNRNIAIKAISVGTDCTYLIKTTKLLTNPCNILLPVQASYTVKNYIYTFDKTNGNLNIEPVISITNLNMIINNNKNITLIDILNNKLTVSVKLPNNIK